MKEKVLVLYDGEEEYARQMSEFLKRKGELPWQLYTYTDGRELVRLAGEKEIALLLVAENVYTEEIREIPAGRTVLLNECGLIRWNHVCNISKYQEADCVLRRILEICADMEGVELPRLEGMGKTRFIGMYSPVRRCLQTSFALTLGQLLSRSHKTLYLNFEHYGGITDLLPEYPARDMADLLFFLTSDKGKFRMRMQAMIQSRGGLDYIPPMRAGQNLVLVTWEEWRRLFQSILAWGEYEYVILDLSENLQGLFDILRMCTRVFMLTKEDGPARSKILQYEQMLELADYRDVMEKTSKWTLPLFRALPEELEQFTKGGLAEYVENVIRTTLEG